MASAAPPQAHLPLLVFPSPLLVQGEGKGEVSRSLVLALLHPDHGPAARIQLLIAAVIEVLPASRTLHPRRMSPDNRDRWIRRGSRETAVNRKILLPIGVPPDFRSFIIAQNRNLRDDEQIFQVFAIPLDC